MVLLKKGEKYSAFVTDVNFFGGKELAIWAQIGEDVENTLNEITEELHKESSSAQPLESIQTGFLCACKYIEDEQWYRALILQSTLDEKWIARFIDYGNTQIFEKSELFQLSPKLQEVPPLATALFLHETLRPIDTANVWTSGVAKVLYDLLLYVEIEITVERVTDGRIQIDCKMVNDILISRRLACVETTSYPYTNFPIHHKFNGYVSYATESGNLMVQDQKMSESLDELMNELTNHLSLTENRISIQPSEIAPGTLIAALYSCDQQFYRAQIRSIMSKNMCVVYYIDYGNEEKQEISSLFELPRKYCILPYMCISCEFHNIAILDACNGKNLKNFILDQVEGQLLQFEVMNHIYTLSSSLSVTIVSSGENLISCLLVSKGFAKLRRDFTFEFKFNNIDVRSQEEVYISHVEPNGVFYVSKTNEALKLDKLMDDLAEYCENAAPLTEAAVGMACCALYDQDNSWYRAEIKNIHGNKCEVTYVDYGNTSSCDMTRLRKITSEYVDLPCQAVECHILRQLNPEELKMLEVMLGETVEVIFIQKTDQVNSYYVKVLYDSKVLFPPILKKELTDFIKMDIHARSSYKVKILNFVSLEDVWGRLVSNENMLQCLCNELNKVYNEETMDKYIFKNSLEIGTACIVNYKDCNQWCRGKVVGLNSPNVYLILLVDVGITKEFPNDQLRKITSNFFELPCQAIHLAFIDSKLDSFIPANLPSLLVDNIFTVNFINYDKDSDIYQVELPDESANYVKMLFAQTSEASNANAFSTETSSETFEHIMKLQAAVALPQTDASLEVAVCFIEDPDCMWLQLQSNSQKLFKLLKDMQNFYSNLPSNILTFEQPQYHALCAVRVKNPSSENWYRGRILCLYGDVIEVKLIDFGNEVKAKQKDIKKLSSRFSQPEAQALKCKLYNILPKSKHWTNSCIQEITLLTDNATNIKAKFLEKQRASYVVDLKVNLDGKVLNVNEYLVNQEIAVWQDASKVGANELSTPHNVMDASTTTSPLVSKPRIYYQSPGIAFVGAEVKVIASEVISPDDFFLQINDACHRHKYASLIGDLNHACNKSERLLVNENDLYVGIPCAVFYDHVQQWCRGAILSFENLEDLQVCLVDYGCMVSYAVNEVRVIDPQLVLKAPPEAMRCTLQGLVKPKDGLWSPKASSLCKDFFESDHRNLICTIHACAGNELCTYFICSVRTPLRNLVDELINANLAIATDVVGMLTPPLRLKSFLYSNLGQVKGKEDSFYVTHISAPNLFYCQLSKNFSSIEDLMCRLQQHCVNNYNPVTVEDLIQDCMCFAKYQEKWHRAHIVASSPIDHVKVLFVDYGITEIIPINDVQKFNNSIFSELPVQALPCSFKDIDIASLSFDQQRTLHVTMQDYLVEKEFKGIVIGSTNGKLHLDLFLDGKRVNEIITSKLTPIKLQILNNVCDSDLFESTEKDNEIHLVEPTFVQPNVTEAVTLASCINPNDFYLWPTKLDSDRINCINTIDGLYTAMRNADYKLDSLMPGDIICARRSKDMKWCRAKVLSVTDNDVDVFYVDTGETDTVLRAYDVKQLILKMSKWPKMAVSCSLIDAKPVNAKNWSSKAVLKFQYFVNNSSLKVHFQQKDKTTNKWLVKLEKDGTDLSKYLVQQGVAFLQLGGDLLIEKSPQNIIDIDMPSIWQNECEVFISHVVSSNELYIQDVNALDMLDKLKVETQDDSNLILLAAQFKENMFCLARYIVDNELYRAQILDIVDSSSCRVFFVDYGNCASVSKADVFQLDKKYANLPQLAVRCRLTLTPNSLSSSKIVTKLEDLSTSEKFVLLASFSSEEHGDCNVVNIRVQDPDLNYIISLESYLFNENPFESPQLHQSSMLPQSNQLHYSLLEDILKEGSCSIYISHIENPGHVFCQLSKFCDELDTLMNSIECYYDVERSEDEIKDTLDMPVGSPCVAKFAVDNAWYRGAVEEIVDADHLKVRFVDYGNCETLPLTNVRKSKIGFCSLPVQAIQCYVALVDHNNDSWSSEEIESYDTRVATLQLSATFSRLIDVEKNIFEVMLRLPDGTLLNKEYMKNNELNDVNDDDDGNQTDIDKTIPLSKRDDNANEPAANYEKFDIKPLHIEEGMQKKCYISYAEGINNFYLQFAGSEEDINFLYTSTSGDANISLSNSSSLNYEQVFPIHSFCVAKSPEDGQWYRSQIAKLGDKPTVYFVDYGNCARVDWSFIKPLSKATANLPMQAVSCFLSNLARLSTEVYDEAVEIFFDLVENALLDVKFLKKTQTSWEVSIAVNGQDVDQKILLEIFRKYPDEFLKVFKNEPVPPVSNDTSLMKSKPDSVMCGKVIYVINCKSIYVKINSIIASTLTLTYCSLEKRSDNTCHNGIHITGKSSEEELVLIDDVCCSIKDYKIKEHFKSQVFPFSILVCKLQNLDGIDPIKNISLSSVLSKVMNKDVFVLFKDFNHESFVWEVELVYRSISLNDELKSLQQNEKGPQIDDWNYQQWPSNFNETDYMTYTKKVLNQLKNMLLQPLPYESLITLIDEALIEVEAVKCRKLSFEKKTDLPLDDHKRPFSEFLSIPAPCKKPRLDKKRSPTTADVIVPQTVKELIQDQNVPSTPTNLRCNHLLESTIVCAESPNVFFVKPKTFDFLLSPIDKSLLINMEDIKKLSLCAFEYSNNYEESPPVKRGYIVDYNTSEVFVRDIDSGFKYVIAPDKIYNYPEVWISQEPSIVCCCLYGLLPNEGDWSEKACLYFDDITTTTDEPITVKFKKKCVSYSPLSYWLVDILIRNQSLRTLMIEEKLALESVDTTFEPSSFDVGNCQDEYMPRDSAVDVSEDKSSLFDNADNKHATMKPTSISTSIAAIGELPEKNNDNFESAGVELDVHLSHDVDPSGKNINERFPGFMIPQAVEFKDHVESDSSKEFSLCEKEVCSPTPETENKEVLAIEIMEKNLSDPTAEERHLKSPGSDQFENSDENLLMSTSQLIEDDATQRLPSFIRITGDDAVPTADLNVTVCQISTVHQKISGFPNVSETSLQEINQVGTKEKLSEHLQQHDETFGDSSSSDFEDAVSDFITHSELRSTQETNQDISSIGAAILDQIIVDVLNSQVASIAETLISDNDTFEKQGEISPVINDKNIITTGYQHEDVDTEHVKESYGILQTSFTVDAELESKDFVCDDSESHEKNTHFSETEQVHVEKPEDNFEVSNSIQNISVGVGSAVLSTSFAGGDFISQENTEEFALEHKNVTAQFLKKCENVVPSSLADQSECVDEDLPCVSDTFVCSSDSNDENSLLSQTENKDLNIVIEKGLENLLPTSINIQDDSLNFKSETSSKCVISDSEKYQKEIQASHIKLEINSLLEKSENVVPTSIAREKDSVVVESESLAQRVVSDYKINQDNIQQSRSEPENLEGHEYMPQPSNTDLDDCDQEKIQVAQSENEIVNTINVKGSGNPFITSSSCQNDSVDKSELVTISVLNTSDDAVNIAKLDVTPIGSAVSSTVNKDNAVDVDTPINISEIDEQSFITVQEFLTPKNDLNSPNLSDSDNDYNYSTPVDPASLLADCSKSFVETTQTKANNEHIDKSDDNNENICDDESGTLV